MVSPIAAFAGIAGLAWLVFRVIARDYQTKGGLSLQSSFLETAIFFVHGCSSYVFLESDLGSIDPASLSFALGSTLIGLGLVGLYASTSRLGWMVSVGRDVRSLRKTGPYRFSRNPQIVAYFFVVAGYSLFWPSLLGCVWVGLYMVIAHMMVRTEEAHLERLFGEEYREYCTRTPRYVGRPKRL